MMRMRSDFGAVCALAIVAAIATSAGAASKAKQCKQACGVAIENCTANGAAFGFGDLSKGCKAAVLKHCKKNGATVCTGFVAPGCSNGKREQNEECDGSDIGGKTCAEFGFSGGTLACTATCTLDSNGC